MTANLTPQYREAEQRYRQATEPGEKLIALREMLALMPKHKGTEKMQADLKKKIAQYEEEAERPKKKGGHTDPGHIRHEGAGQWILIGPPNGGKSALLKALTHAHPEVAPYPFTTRVPLPGMMPFEDALVQLVDTPAVTPTHAESYLVNLLRGSDGVVLVADITADDVEDGVKAVQAQLEKARVWPLARPLTPEAAPIFAPRPVIVAANKTDLDSDGTFLALAREAIGSDLPVFPVSAEAGTGLDELRRYLWTELHRIRIYAKEPGKKPDLERPFVLKEGATVHDLALQVHKEVAAALKYARIWGKAAFDGQQVDRHHVLADRDVVELHA